MRLTGVAVIAVVSCFAFSASAMCTGTGNFSTCTDNEGNYYTVNRMGNMTTVNGNNANTGSNWSQTSQTVGNMTMTNGIAANGQSWNMTQQHIGNMETYNGTNSRGQPFSYTCTQYGCTGGR